MSSSYRGERVRRGTSFPPMREIRILCVAVGTAVLSLSPMESALADASGANQFVPPSSIPVPLDTKEVAAADVNGDGCDDLVSLAWANKWWDEKGKLRYPDAYPTVELRLNKGCDRKASEGVAFEAAEEVLVLSNTLVIEKGGDPEDQTFWPSTTFMTTMVVNDLDQDGLPDLILTDASAARVIVMFNQGKTPAGGKHFAFAPDDRSKTVIFDEKLTTLAYHWMLNKGPKPWNAGGLPLYTTVLDLNGDGYNDLLTYWANQPDGSTAYLGQFEAFSVFLGTAPSGGAKYHMGFDPIQRTIPWVKLKIGNNAKEDGFPWDTTLFKYNWSATDKVAGNGVGELFHSRIIDPGLLPGDQGYIDLAPTPFVVDKGSEVGGGDSVWFTGRSASYKLVWDAVGKRMVQADPAKTTINPHGTSSAKIRGGMVALKPSSKPGGKSALMVAGGSLTYYPPINKLVANGWVVPSFYNRDYQFGAWFAYKQLDSGPALLTLADYLQPGERVAGDTNEGEFNINRYYAGERWGHPASLIIAYADETDDFVQPLLQDTEHSYFQEIPTASSMRHHPQIGVGKFGSKSEQAIYVLEDGSISIYRPNIDRSYLAPTIKLLGVTPDSLTWLADDPTELAASKTLFKGENGFLVGQLSSTDQKADPIRYVIAKQGGKTIRVFRAQHSTDDANTKFYVYLPGLGDLPKGNYQLEAWNSTYNATVDVTITDKVENLVSTDLDWRSNRDCGILPSTIAGKMYPNQFRITTKGLTAGAFQTLRFARIPDNKSWDVAAGAGAALTGDEIAATVPSDLANGSYVLRLKANGIWQNSQIGNAWTFNAKRDDCDKLVNAPNNLTPAQNDASTLYLASKTYVFPRGGQHTFPAGEVEFMGSGFGVWRVKSVALKQPGTSNEVWDDDPAIAPRDGSDVWNKDGYLTADWGDLTGKFAEGKPVDLYFYPETKAELVRTGAPPLRVIKSWRTPKAGSFADPMPINIDPVPNLTFNEGEVIKIHGAGLVWPGPVRLNTSIYTGDKKFYLFNNGSLKPDDSWFTTPKTNEDATLIGMIPQNAKAYEIPVTVTSAKAPVDIATILSTGPAQPIPPAAGAAFQAPPLPTGSVPSGAVSATFSVVAIKPGASGDGKSYAQLTNNNPTTPTGGTAPSANPGLTKGKPVTPKPGSAKETLFIAWYVKRAQPDKYDDHLYSLIVCANANNLTNIGSKAIAIREHAYPSDVGAVGSPSARNPYVKILQSSALDTGEPCVHVRPGGGADAVRARYNVNVWSLVERRKLYLLDLSISQLVTVENETDARETIAWQRWISGRADTWFEWNLYLIKDDLISETQPDADFRYVDEQTSWWDY